MEMQRRAADRNRGQLKIFFGYAPGVGKTCAMLQAAQDARRRGVDVVCGWVDDHGRPGTRSRMGALERLPMMRLPNGAGEFDLDAALRRRPKLILLDEINHVNAPICRHSRRYQDVEELLNAGIDVYATVNVQHIESLNDQVAAITGAPERERIPDEVFDRADQVELVDVEPEDLLERMRAERGDVNWTLETLRALREIALRRCADRVNLLTGDQRARFHTDEHVLVCLSSAPSNARIIRTAARMAAAFHGGFTALYVETPDFSAMSEADRDRLRANMRLARQLGATIETVCGDDIPYQIAEFARLSGVSKIVLGRSAAAHKRLIPKPSLTDQLIARAPSMDIYIIPDSASDADYRPRRSRGPLAGFSPWDILKSFVVLLGATALSVAFYELGFS